MSIILAKIFGMYFLCLGIAFFIHPDGFKNITKQFTKEDGCLFLGAIIALLLGSTIITIHNVWTLSWPVIITLLGWWSLTKGFLLLSFPAFIQSFTFIQNKASNFYRMISVIYAAIGLFFIYVSL